MHSDRMHYWNAVTNKPTMPELEATEAQKRLYDAYGEPLSYVPQGEKLMAIRVPIDVQTGVYKGPCGVTIRFHGGGFVSETKKVRKLF